MELKKNVIQYNYALLESVNGELSAPQFFTTLFEAQEEMASRVAIEFEEDEKNILECIIAGKDDEDFEFVIADCHTVYGEVCELYYRWQIFLIPDMYRIAEDA